MSQQVKALEGKRVTVATLEENSITLVFEDGSRLTAAARSGEAGSDWHTWTEISLNGEKLVDV